MSELIINVFSMAANKESHKNKLTKSRSPKLGVTLLVIGLCILGITVFLWSEQKNAETLTGVEDGRDKTAAGEQVSTTTTPEEGFQEELPPIELTPEKVTFRDGTAHTFRLAKTFDLAIAASGLGKARFMTMSPDGRFFVPDLVNYNLSHQGKLYILDDFNPETMEFESKHVYLSGLRGPNSVAFYTDDSGQTWLYLALTKNLLRYPYEPGDLEPSGEPEVVASFPNKQAPKAGGVV